MQRILARSTLVVAVALIVAGALGRFGSRTADADSGAPTVQAFANAPGWITVVWTSNDDPAVDWYTLQRQDNQYPQYVGASGTFTDTGLKPATTYKYEVCAVYDYSSACSPWVAATTLSSAPSPKPSASPSPSPSPSPAPSQPALVGPSNPEVTGLLSGAVFRWTPASGPWTSLYVSCWDVTANDTPTTPAEYKPCGFADGTSVNGWRLNTANSEGMAFTTAPDTANEFNFTTLTPGHQYQFKACAQREYEGKIACTRPVTLTPSDPAARPDAPAGAMEHSTISVLDSQGAETTTVVAGAPFTVSGSGFLLHPHVTIHLDSADGPALATVTVDGASFSQAISLLSGTAVGGHTLLVVDGSTVVTQLAVTVTPPWADSTTAGGAPGRCIVCAGH